MQSATNASLLRFAKQSARAALVCAAGLLLVTPQMRAQEPERQGIDSGNYNVKQSIEFGGRITDFTGNPQTYQTFVNLKDGARLLGFTTEMRSLDHRGWLFDRLYFSNFGYGGDPNNVSHLRMSRNKWYDFNALFRRGENFWDYSLLANPLNPTTPPFANAPAGFTPIISNSPHLFSTRRRLGDYNFLLLPQSRVRLRLGYARNIAEGPSLTSFHEGTEALLLQDWKTTVNTYRLGVDLRLLPRTNISYDQLWNYYKGDTGLIDNNQLFALANGTPVDIGIALNAGANQPCAGTFTATGDINPACNAFLNYTRHGRARTSAPTEQISMQSNYFQSVDLSARLSYSGGDAIVNNWVEALTGRASRTNIRNRDQTGPVFGRRVASSADFGATWHITDKLSFLDSFHFSSFHNPMEWDTSTCQFFSPNLLTGANLFSPASPLPIACAPPSDGVAGTPAHSTSSGPDVSLGISSLFLKQDEKTNLVELEYRFTPRLGARLGYRFRHRTILESDFTSVTEVFFPSNANRGHCALVAGNLPPGCTANGDGSFTFVTPAPEPDSAEALINEHAAVVGIWARPLTNWRISFDTELMSADNAFTRVSPRQTQEYRIRSTYKPVSWFTFMASMYIWEGRNNVEQINNLQHNRAYGFSAIFEPSQKFALELGYDYNDVFSQILICYTASTAPPGLAKCPGSTVLVQQLSTYTNKSNMGYFDLMWMPFKRLTTHLGTNITGTSGSVLIISPNAPAGPLDSNYYKPYGGLDYSFTNRWTGKAYWNYYGYGEGLSSVAQDVFAPRNFRGNIVTLSVRYAF